MPESKAATATTVAVIGASNDRAKFGNKAVRAFARQGYHVVPINPRERQVEGWPAYRSVLEVAEAIEMATFYVPPAVGEQVIDEVARKGIAEVWLNPGSESDALVAKARAHGIETIVACSILGIGESPGKY